MTSHTKPTLDWLSDVSVFAVNRLEAHSDHRYYTTMAEARLDQEMKLRHSLNGTWKFNYSVNPKTRPKDFYRLEYDSSGWEFIKVPGHMQLQGFGKPHYVNTMYPWDGINDIQPPEIPEDKNLVGSYIKEFLIPEHMQEKPLYISFQGVETAFFVWLNGKFVGYSEDSFTPSDFELTPYVQEGENKLCVEVYQRSTGSWLEDQDFWRFSGIYRDVYLYTKPSIHIEDLFVKTKFPKKYSEAILEIDLKLSEVVKGSKVKLLLEDTNEKVIGEIEKDISELNETISLQVSNPKLWSAEEPNLYQAYIQIYDEEYRLVEVVPQKIGFRHFELKNKIMYLNGKRIVFKGVNRHEFNCYHGRSITKEDMLWDIKTLKQNNINAVRTSHYPNQTYWYELCDEYGIYVMDEVNLETHGTWSKLQGDDFTNVIPGNRMEWKDIVMDRAISMFERDKNHPSILIWSCGNESYGGQVLLDMSNYFRKVDPSRLVHYEGTVPMWDRSYDGTSDMKSRMYAKVDEIEEYLNNDPERPFIVCEYMHAMGNSVGGMDKYVELEQKYEMYQGGFIWDYIDQGLMKKDRYGNEFIAYGGDFDDRPTDYNFCINGIIYADRKLSPKVQEIRYLYQDVKLFPDRKGVHIQNDYLFKDLSEYMLEYRLFHEGEEIYSNQIEVRVNPLDTKYIELDYPQIKEVGEYVIHTSLVLKEQTLWANQGYEIAFGEHVFKHEEKTFELPGGTVYVVDGLENIGIHGEYFSILFSKGMGTIVSLKYSDLEMIAKPPFPLFWRALTDNDRGNQSGFDMSAWYAANIGMKCIQYTVLDKESHAKVRFDYSLAIHSDVKLSVTYTVYANGTMKVCMDYQGVKGLPNMPIFALSFATSANFDRLKWYARGPEENYRDRAAGARLGIFENKVSDNISDYVIPQESGNRTGVRWVNIKNNQGRGIRISATNEPLECNVSPYTAYELENARHHYELPNIHHTVITVAHKQMGVGGDDSWGAPVHEEFQINAEKTLSHSFFISPIE